LRRAEPGEERDINTGLFIAMWPVVFGYGVISAANGSLPLCDVRTVIESVATWFRYICGAACSVCF
jgi:hypothetical protein